MNGEPLECAVCQHVGRDVAVVLIDAVAEREITHRPLAPGVLYVSEPRCSGCYAAYRRLLDARAERFLGPRPSHPNGAGR